MKFLILLTLCTTLLTASIGKVSSLQGEATLSQKNVLTHVKKGSSVEENDLLSTAPSSRAQVILNDDTVITIGPNSEYLFVHYSNGNSKEVEMRLKRGFFKTVTGKIGKVAPERFKIKTKAATIGIRGTQFMAYVGREEERIGCIQGSIIVWTDEGEFIVDAGEMLTYKDKHWKRMKIDIYAFAPVMVGLVQKENKVLNERTFLPHFQNRYLLEEQILNLVPTSEPFSFDFNSNNNPVPPPYNP